ncbi:hypothetical protein [Metapseudomonas otitidis]|nr:hypothetical protein [Pseudomonas otitidis]
MSGQFSSIQAVRPISAQAASKVKSAMLNLLSNGVLWNMSITPG